MNKTMSWIKECVTYISADLFRYTGKTGVTYFIKQYFVRGQGFRFSVWLRICHFSKRGKAARYTIFPFARIIYNHYMIKYGYDISYDTDIGPGLLIYHFSGIVFRPEKAGKNMTISQCTTVGMTIHDGEKSYPVLGDNVYLAPGSKVIGGIMVGNNVSIGANAVLTNSVADNAVVVGIPGKVISYRGSAEYVNNPLDEGNE